MDTSSSSQQQHDSSSSRTRVWVRTTHLAEALAKSSSSSSRSLVGRKASSNRLAISNSNSNEEPTDWGWVKGYLLSDNEENENDRTKTTSALADVGEESSSDVGLDKKKKVKVLIQETNEELASSSVYDGQTFDIDADGIVIANPWEIAYDNNDESGYDSYSDDDDDDDGVTAGPLEEERLPPDDLIDLIHLHEPAVVYALQCRYDMDMVYTSTGPILLALNPFKQCTELYGEETMAKYWEYGERKALAALESGGGGEGEGEEEQKKLEPHVYAVADYTFRNMMRHLKERNESGGGGGARGGGRGMSRRQLGKTKGGGQQSGGGGGSEVTCDQSILVSGESGAGKTVTTKFIMKYLAALSQRSSAAASAGVCTTKGEAGAAKTTGGGGVNIEQQVLQSNPILESFGNARTIRNDNSSRFGKFIEIHFTDNGMLVGASIETYLLEKVRLIHQSEGERNYHIYYELLAHMMEEDENEDEMVEEDRKRYFLEDMTVEDFKMTSCSGTFDRRDGVDDYDTYLELVTAMDTMGFTKSEQTSIMTIISTCLHSSNLTFIDLTTNNNDECELDKTNPSLDAVVTLMGVTIEELNNALCYFTITARNETLTQCLNKGKAEKGMEALIKAMHGALFTYLVRRINESITVPGSEKRSQHQQKRTGGSAGSGRRTTRSAGAGSGAAATIGVLDIFGFESFQTNSFEQLCINYCNEALQQQFNLFVLKNEQEEYDREGIQWSFIQFPENQDVLNLIHLKGSGILNILDDQCKTPGTTDQTFASAMYKKCSKHPRFELSSRQEAECLFGIKHYAGSVEYNTVGFVEKNRDELPREATELLLKSKNEFIRHLGTILCSQSGTAPPTTAKSTARHSSSNKGPTTNTRPTVGSQFSSQLHTLREKIDITSPHYIRCLKPNDQLTPDNFNPKIIAHQLRCAGVVEAVRVSRLGYPQRYSHGMFTTRYRVLDNGGGGLKNNKVVDRRGGGRRRGRPVDQLVNAVVKKVDDLGWLNERKDANKKSDGEEGTSTAMVTTTSTKDASASTVGIQVGKTKVFLRRQAYEMLEKLRTMKMISSTIIIQTTVRTFVARKKYSTIRQSVLVLQCYVKMLIATRVVMIKRRHYRATILQKSYRKHCAERQYLSIVTIVKWVQRVQRGRIDRIKYDQINKQRKACTIQRYYRRHHAIKTYHTKLASVLVMQCAIRCYLARCVYRNLKLKARDMQFISEERDQFRKEAERLREQLVKSREEKSVEDTTSKEMIIRLQQELDEAQQRSKEVDKVRTEIEDEKKELENERKELELALEIANTKSSESVAQLQVLQKENEELNKNLERAIQIETDVRIEMESLRATAVAAAAAAAAASQQTPPPPDPSVVQELESLQREKDTLSKELETIRRTSANNELEMEALRTKAASVERITKELDTLKRERDELQEELKNSVCRRTGAEDFSPPVVPAEIEILRTKAASADAVAEEMEVLKRERDALQEELDSARRREEEEAATNSEELQSSDSTSDYSDDDDEKIETLRAKAEMADALAEELDAVRNENEALHEELKRGEFQQLLLDTDSMPAQTMSSVSTTITEEELRRENESLRTELTDRQQEIELLHDETNEMRIDLEQTVEAFALQAQENSDLKKEMDMLREHIGTEEASKALLEEQLALEMNQLREELAVKEEESRTVERELTNEIHHLRERFDHAPCIDATNSFPPGGCSGEHHGSSEDGGIVKQEWILQELNRLWSEVGKLKHEEEEETAVVVPHQHGLDNQDPQRTTQEQRIHSTSNASLHTKGSSSGFGSSVVGTSGGGGSVSTHASSFRTPVSREQQQGLHPPRHGQGYGQHDTYATEGPILSPYGHDEDMDAAASVSSRTARSHSSRSRKSPHYPDADNMEASVGSRTSRSHTSSRSHRISSSRTENADMEASVGSRTTARSHHTSRTSSRALKISPLISEILTTVDNQAHLPSVRGLVDNEEEDEEPSATANDIDFFRDSDPVVYAAVTSSRSNNNSNRSSVSSNNHAADSPVMMSRHRAPTRREMGDETRMFRSRSAKGQRSENNRVGGGGGGGGGGRSRSRDSAERISRRWKQSGHLGGEKSQSSR